MGELHLEIIVERLRREFEVEAKVGRPKVAYRETIRKTVDQEGRFVRQFGGRGKYGHVHLRLESLPPGSGLATMYTAAITARVCHESQAEQLIDLLIGAGQREQRERAGFVRNSK